MGKLKIRSKTAVLSAVLILLTVFAPAAYAYTNTGNAVNDIIGVAREQIGYTEGADGYTKYGEYFGNSKMDWCCAFVAWCAVKAEISQNIIPSETSCTAMKKSFETKERYYRSAKQGGSYTPKAGDLIFFSSTKSAFNITHIGLVSSVSGNTVNVIEGNYSDKVAATTYSLDNDTVVGYANPDYGANATMYKTGKYITNEVMNFRSEPNTSAKIYMTIPVNTTVEVKEIKGVWGKITYGGYTGWMNLEYSTFIPPEPETDPENPPEIAPEEKVNWLVADFSKWNTEKQINWNGLKADGVKAVILRIGGRGYGSAKTLYTDDAFYDHYKSAKAAGIHVGAYFFSYALNETQAKEEADLTIKQLKEYNCDLDMPVFIDIEDADNDHQHYRAGKKVCSAVVNKFCDTIKQAGYFPGIYCSKWFAEDMLDSSVFANRAVWIAQYGVVQCGYKGEFDMWQYTQSGSLSSVKGNVDLSRCYTNFPLIIKKMNEPETQAPEPTQPQPEPEPDVTQKHNLPGEWTVTKEATCSADGAKAKVCKDCSKTVLTEYVPKTAHTESVDNVYINNYSIKVGSTLTGDEIKWLHPSTDANYDILYLETYKLKGGTKLKYCTACKKVLYAEYSYPDCSHASLQTKETASTCSVNGVREYVCTKCSKTVKAEILPLKAHTAGETKLFSDNCTNGVIKKTYCAVCAAEVRSELTDISEHSFKTEKVLVWPTLFSEGSAIFTCSVCGAQAEDILPPLSLGDIDADGKTDAADARLALRTAVDLESPQTEGGAQAGDTDNDGKITADDARTILRIAVGLEDPDLLFEKYYVSED